jgi:AraC-like DNA-binding protein/ligand-binding sensor domain-containing protein
MKTTRTIIVLLISLCLSIIVEAEETYRHVHYDDHSGMSQWHVTKMLQDKRGFMWFSTWNGLNRFDGYEFAVFKSKPGDGNNLTSDRIRNMLLGEDDNIYCVINEVVWRFNLSTYKFEAVDRALAERYLARMNSDALLYKQLRNYQYGDISLEDIRQYMQDSQKNHWFMERFGVSKVSQVRQPAQFLDVIPRSTVRAMYCDRKKRIWIGTRDTNVLAVLDSTLNLIGYLGRDGRLHREQTEFYPIYSVFQQKNGLIWVGTKPNGLFRLRETSDGVFDMESFIKGTAAEIKAGRSIGSNDIYSFQEDSHGRLWIATQGGGLNLVLNPTAPAADIRFANRENTFTTYPRNALLMRRVMMTKGGLMLATTTEGLIVIAGVEGDPRKVTFTMHQRESMRESSLSCSAVMDMLIDRKGRLFVSSESGGVNMLLTDDLTAKQFEFKHYNTDNGMGSDAALAMTEVGDEILIQCNNQLTRLNADLGTIENFNDMFFSTASHFSDAEPLLLPDGRWLLSLENGVMVISEQAFHLRPYVPRIAFTAFNLPNLPPDYSADKCDTLRLTSGERDVTVRYAALDYSDNANIRYVTRVTEQRHWWQRSDSAAWSVPSENRALTLYNLSPGTYTLEVRSTNAEGLWADNTRTLTIIVEPMLWETWWARLLYVLLIAAVVGGVTYTYMHIKELRRQREENLRKYLSLLEKMNDEDDSSPSSEEGGVVNNDSHAGHESQYSDTDEVDASQSPLVIVNEEDEAFMQRVLQFVDHNMSNSDVGVDEMALATATSRSSLNRRMKQLMGVTPADFLKEARMKRAKQLLATTMRSVNEIAYGCGFSDPKYFSKCFKFSEGMSPSEYRARVQNAG